MKKFFCYGKKDFCENTDLCVANCQYFDSSGGKFREEPMTKNNASLTGSRRQRRRMTMMLEIYGADGSKVRIRNVVSVGELRSRPGELYYQQRNKRNGNVTVHEYFVPFDKIDGWIYG